MRWQLTTPPTLEPVKVADVRTHSRITAADLDDGDYIDGLITKARKYVEARQRRQLLRATWTVYLDEFPPEIVFRDHLPIAGITSIYYYNTAGVSTLLAPAAYQADYASQDSPCRVMPAYGYSWPSTRADIYNAVTIIVTNGYGTTAATVPETIKHAILLLAAHWYEHREPVVPGGVFGDVPFTIESLIHIESWGAYA